jgi:hypothetical protein
VTRLGGGSDQQIGDLAAAQALVGEVALDVTSAFEVVGIDLNRVKASRAAMSRSYFAGVARRVARPLGR